MVLDVEKPIRVQASRSCDIKSDSGAPRERIGISENEAARAVSLLAMARVLPEKDVKTDMM